MRYECLTSLEDDNEGFCEELRLQQESLPAVDVPESLELLLWEAPCEGAAVLEVVVAVVLVLLAAFGWTGLAAAACVSVQAHANPSQPALCNSHTTALALPPKNTTVPCPHSETR